jgi:hypothetical protein
MTLNIDVSISQERLIQSNKQESEANRHSALAERREEEDNKRQAQRTRAIELEKRKQNLDNTVKKRSNTQISRKKESPIAWRKTGIDAPFGIGWIAQEATEYAAEAVACLGSKFTIHCGNCTKSQTFTVENYYNPSASTANSRFSFYEHYETIYPVSRDRFILWIVSYPDRPQIVPLPVVHNLFLIGYNDVKKIEKPADLDPYFSSYPESGFAFFRDSAIINSFERTTVYTLFPAAIDLYRNIKLDELNGIYYEESDFFGICGNSWTNIAGEGYNPIGDRRDFEDSMNPIVGSGYIYSEALGRPMGNTEAPEGSFDYYGMKSPPMRLSKNSQSCWSTFSPCASADLVFGNAFDRPSLLPFASDWAYGYASSPVGQKYEMQYMTGNPSWGLNPETWWKNLQANIVDFDLPDMDDRYWKSFKYSLAVNSPLPQDLSPWGISVFNEGFTDWFYPSTASSFFQIISNPWGRDWTSQLLELGFLESDLIFGTT